VPIVVDASVTMAWCFEDEATDYTEAALERVGAEGAVVPCIWSYEVANVLTVAERAGRVTQSKSAEFAGLLGELPIDVEDVDLSSALGPILATSGQFGLSAYDAAYLELAARQGLALAANDGRLRKAADQAGVAIVGEAGPPDHPTT